MADIGLDYAGSSPGAAAVKAAGFNFVARYLSRYTAKTIRLPEYQNMVGNGVGVVLVFEDYANQALQGYAQGAADAQVALDQANALGWPADRPIHFAVDFDISDAQKPAAGEYMKGVHSVIGLARTGAYGGYYWIKYCDENGLAAPNARWQAVAWSGGQVHPTATLFQRLGGVTVNGTSCDVNDALKSDYGQGGHDMSTIATQDMVNSLANAYLEDNTDKNPSLEMYVGMPVETVIDAFNGAAERNNYLVSINEARNGAAQVPGLQKQVSDLEARVKELENKPDPTPTPAPNPTPTPDPTPPVPQQSFWEWLKSLFSKKS